MKVQKKKIVAHITRDHAVVHFLPTTIRDLHDVATIMAEVEEVAYNYKITVMVLNFARIKQLTSAFLGKMIALHRSLKQSGIELRVCCMTADVEKAFRICKLEKLIPLFDSEDKAIME